MVSVCHELRCTAGLLHGEGLEGSKTDGNLDLILRGGVDWEDSGLKVT